MKTTSYGKEGHNNWVILRFKKKKSGGKSNPAASEQGWPLCRARLGAKPRHAQLSALDAHQPAARSPTYTHVVPVLQHAQRGTGTLKCERSVVEARSELQRRDFSAASPITLIRPVPVLSSPLLAASLERPVPGRCLQSAAGCAGGELPAQPGGPAGSGHPSQGLHFWGAALCWHGVGRERRFPLELPQPRPASCGVPPSLPALQRLNCSTGYFYTRASSADLVTRISAWICSSSVSLGSHMAASHAAALPLSGGAFSAPDAFNTFSCCSLSGGVSSPQTSQETLPGSSEGQQGSALPEVPTPPQPPGESIPCAFGGCGQEQGPVVLLGHPPAHSKSVAPEHHPNRAQHPCSPGFLTLLPCKIHRVG